MTNNTPVLSFSSSFSFFFFPFSSSPFCTSSSSSSSSSVGLVQICVPLSQWFLHKKAAFSTEQYTSLSLFSRFEVSRGDLNHSLKNYGLLCDAIFLHMYTCPQITYTTLPYISLICRVELCTELFYAIIPTVFLCFCNIFIIMMYHPFSSVFMTTTLLVAQKNITQVPNKKTAKCFSFIFFRLLSSDRLVLYCVNLSRWLTHETVAFCIERCTTPSLLFCNFEV